jgi:outer membrane protein assembly factor BamD (BamD/ComL family)
MSDKDTSYYINQIDSYLDGTLTKFDKDAFSTALQENEELKNELEHHILARAIIRQKGEEDLKAKFKDAFVLEQSDTAQELEKQTEIKTTSKSWLLGLLLLLLLASLAYFFTTNKSSKNTKEDTEYFAAIEDPSYKLFRSEEDMDSVSILWNRTLRLFNNNEYQNTITSLKDIDENPDFVKENSGKLLLMKGVSLMHLEKYKEAINELKLVDEDNPYYDQVTWNLALAHYFDGNKENCQQILETIIKNKDHYKVSDATKLLGQLK